MFDPERPFTLSSRIGQSEHPDVVQNITVGVPFELNNEGWKLLALFREPRSPSAVADAMGLEGDARAQLFGLLTGIARAGLLVPGDGGETEENYLFRVGASLAPEARLAQPATTFLGASADQPHAHFHIVGVPFDRAALRPGAAQGPASIRLLSQAMPCVIDPSTGLHRGMRDLSRGGERILEGVRLCDHGDVVLPPAEGHLAIYDRIASVARRIATTTSGVPVYLGGDHSITEPILRALDARPVFVVHFDAHTDLYTLFEGTPHAHGNVMERVWRMPHVLGMLQIGVRDVMPPWWESPAKVRQIGDQDAQSLTPEELLEHVPADAAVYLTIDIDVLSPADAAGTGTPMPGGLSLDRLCRLVEGVGRAREVVGMDLVEVAPGLGGGDTTPIAAMRILLRAMNAIHRRAGSRGPR